MPSSFLRPPDPILVSERRISISNWKRQCALGSDTRLHTLLSSDLGIFCIHQFLFIPGESYTAAALALVDEASV